jgi:hypothetical protein
MTSLTCRRDPDASHEAWLIFLQSCARRHDQHAIRQSYRRRSIVVALRLRSGSNPSDTINGTATNFDVARAPFESARSVFLSRRTEADFQEYPRYRASDAWKQTMWKPAVSCRPKPQTARSRCFCGAAISIANMDEHSYAAHMEPDAK